MSRLRAAWAELWESQDASVTLYVRARHAAQARIESQERPLPDKDVMRRMAEREHGTDKIARLRRAGW